MTQQQDDKFHGEQTETREFFDNFKAFWSRWGNYIVFALLIAMAPFALKTQIENYRIQQKEDAAQEIATYGTPLDFNAGAEKFDNQKWLLKLAEGDLYLDMAIKTPLLGDSTENLGRALEVYSEISTSEEAAPIIRANALEGMAKISESFALAENKPEDARQAYKVTAEFARQHKLTAFAERAEASLALLDSLADIDPLFPVSVIDNTSTENTPPLDTEASTTPEISPQP